ncbi:MAG: hypothetical protein K2K36_10400 [Muribaculaceae bacterium]|nr:hypothetical protein [Muribaculaceae bacterium]
MADLGFGRSACSVFFRAQGGGVAVRATRMPFTPMFYLLIGTEWVQAVIQALFLANEGRMNDYLPYLNEKRG